MYSKKKNDRTFQVDFESPVFVDPSISYNNPGKIIKIITFNGQGRKSNTYNNGTNFAEKFK
jgi:hypothetical protein